MFALREIICYLGETELGSYQRKNIKKPIVILAICSPKIIMVSLTGCLKEIKEKHGKNFLDTDRIDFPLMSGNKKVINFYPDSVGTRRIWSLVGTFTDYMIRKMFRDGNVSTSIHITPEPYLMAEKAMNMVVRTLARKKTKESVLEELGWVDPSTDISLQDQVVEWIRAYKEEPWQDCIRESFYMSQLDVFYRIGMLGEFHNLSEEDEQCFQTFFQRILELLQEEFSEAKRVILNPILSHPEIVLADADLVIDSTLYDIKTVKESGRAIRANKDQLLGYVALAQYHETNKTEGRIQLNPLDSVGYIFPLALSSYKIEIPKFTKNKRLKFCDKLISFRRAEFRQRLEKQRQVK
ncbi:MAG: hypothetical protein ACTSWA_09765 [Candidatus Thorarchaeota archaeon]